MLKIAGFCLLGLIAVMVIPSAVSTDTAPMMLYGTANVELANADGNVVFAQTVHNRILDSGEEFIIDQVFDTGTTALTGDSRVSSICLVGTSGTWFDASGDASVPEGLTTAQVDANIATGTAPCIDVDDVDDDTTSTAILTGTFTAGTEVAVNSDIGGVAVCANGGDTATCSANSGMALAAVNFADQNMGASGSTLAVTYTFDATTPST